MESTFVAVGGFIKFSEKRASKQDQTLHMEGKLHIMLYFREECCKNPLILYIFLVKFLHISLKLCKCITWHGSKKEKNSTITIEIFEYKVAGVPKLLQFIFLEIFWSEWPQRIAETKNKTFLIELFWIFEHWTT